MLCTICMGTIFKCTTSVFLSKENAKWGSSSCIFIEDIWPCLLLLQTIALVLSIDKLTIKFHSLCSSYVHCTNIFIEGMYCNPKVWAISFQNILIICTVQYKLNFSPRFICYKVTWWWNSWPSQFANLCFNTFSDTIKMHLEHSDTLDSYLIWFDKSCVVFVLCVSLWQERRVVADCHTESKLQIKSNQIDHVRTLPVAI